MEDRSGIKITDFSTNLFWDADPNDLDFEKHSRYVIQRVITHGQMADWKLIKNLYGLDQIKADSLRIRSLDNKSLAFLSLILNVPKEEFRCYKLRPYQDSFWNA